MTNSFVCSIQEQFNRCIVYKKKVSYNRDSIETLINSLPDGGLIRISVSVGVLKQYGVN
jgi:hypothetical protein